MKLKPNNILLVVFSAILLSASWHWHLTIFIFFAFVPLLILEDNLSADGDPKRKLKVFGLSYLSFLMWNLAVTWWVVNASLGGALLAFLANSLLMAITFLIFSNIKNRIKRSWAIWLLIPIWLAWEHLHGLWDLAWIWLTLGNVFAFNHKWVQWYEYTGVSGGSLWVLCVNILIFSIIKRYSTLKLLSVPVLKIAASIIVPILISYAIIFFKKPLSEKESKVHTVVVQPNIDPYNEKFYWDYQTQFLKMLKIIRGKITSETEYLVIPETFITDLTNEEILTESDPVLWIRDSLLRPFPKLKIITGANTFSFFKDEKQITITARWHPQAGMYYDEFNTALQIDTASVQVYHKSKLVPGVERMPFPAILKPLEKLAIDMGGTTGSLGTQDERSVFWANNKNLAVAPVICYESIFADYLTGYIRNGATFIFIITNDGWWGNTPGYIQHLNYARLRAIENRRQIARSANTGISCFIDEFGNIYDETEYWKEAVVTRDIFPNKELTFFTKFGDIISYTAVTFSVLTLLFALYLRLKK